MYVVTKSTDKDRDSRQWPDSPFGQGGWFKKMKPKLSPKTLESQVNIDTN